MATNKKIFYLLLRFYWIVFIGRRSSSWLICVVTTDIFFSASFVQRIDVPFVRIRYKPFTADYMMQLNFFFLYWVRQTQLKIANFAYSTRMCLRENEWSEMDGFRQYYSTWSAMLLIFFLLVCVCVWNCSDCQWQQSVFPHFPLEFNIEGVVALAWPLVFCFLWSFKIWLDLLAKSQIAWNVAHNFKKQNSYLLASLTPMVSITWATKYYKW